MYDIEDLMRILGLSENQLRVRLREFRSYLDISRGKNNKLLISPAGVSILQRVKELEEQGLTLDEIKTRLNEELNPEQNAQPIKENSQIQSGSNASETIYKEHIADLRETLALLRKQLEEKDRLIQELYEIIKERLPALPPAKEGGSARRPSRWLRFKQFLRGE